MEDYLWWRDGVIYQIYPRSFSDSNGDGLGDLNGITNKLDYLADLGVDAIWLSPFYPTPDKDFGYDISNYTDVDPRFGTLADFDRLAAEAHRRGIRLVLDLALNHTSDQHAWFVESKSSRDNPKADWYIWRDALTPGPFAKRPVGAPKGRWEHPNNWQSVFGGSGWKWSPERGQFYFHTFLAEQPDVNWRNPETKEALLDVLRFWLERGADGFRFDVFNVFFKDAQFRDNPSLLGIPFFFAQRHLHDYSQAEMMPLLNEMRALLDSYPERYAVGETFFASAQKTAEYCGPDKLHAAFNFDFTYCNFRPGQFLGSIQQWEAATGRDIWPNYVLGNHDIIRPATRYGEGFFGGDRISLADFASEDDARAKVLMALLLTLRGTPFIYYGDEIGMRELFLPKREIMDPTGQRFWPLVKGRDGCRTPMQWDDSPNAGFSSARPWLRAHPDFRTRNVAVQQADPDSLLNLTRKLIQLRRAKPALRRGDFAAVARPPRGALAYRRELAGHPSILAALNFSARAVTLETPGTWTPLLEAAPAQVRERCELRPYGVRVLEEVR